jgi:DNA topoisomerase VI subunit A
VLALVDSDPYGLKILSVYMKGSMNMSYDSSNLTTPDIKWLGVRPSDLDRFNIPEQCRPPMTDEDLKTGRKLVSFFGGCWAQKGRVHQRRSHLFVSLAPAPRQKKRAGRGAERVPLLTPPPLLPKTLSRLNQPNHLPPKHTTRPQHLQTPQLEEDWVRSNPEWVAELQLMLRTRTKAEIQALSSFGFQYLSQVYLPLKLQGGDWI